MPQGWFGVQVVLGKVACIAVRDMGGAGVPAIAAEQGYELSVNGRGLLAVSRLALTMGFDGDSVTGHTVWAELDVRKDPRLRAS
jgi:serine/threonine-protein kinase RsbW